MRSFKHLSLAALLLLGIAVQAAAGDESTPDPNLDAYYNANSMAMRRLYKPAVVQYRSFLKSNPTHAKAPLAKWGLAICLYGIGENAEAAKLFGALAGNAAVKDQEQLHTLWGSALLALNKPAEAQKALEWVLTNGKTPARRISAMVALLDAYSRQKNLEQVLATADKLTAMKPSAAYAELALYHGGDALLRQGKYAEAIKRFAALQSSTKSPDLGHRARYQLAVCHQHLKKYKDAHQWFTAAARDKNGVHKEYVLFKMGEVNFQMGKWNEAYRDLLNYTRWYQKGGRLLPQAALYQGRAQYMLKRYTTADTILKPLLKDPVVGAGALLWLARSQNIQKKHTSAQELLKDVGTRFKDAPLLPDLHFEAGTAGMHTGDFKAAATSFGAIPDAAKMLKPGAVRLQAFCMYQARDFAGALTICDAFLAKYPKHKRGPEVLFIKAESLWRLDRRPEAQVLYKACGKTAPEQSHRQIAALRMTIAQYQAKNWEGCLKALTPLLQERGPAFEQVRFMAGDCHLRLKKWADAQRELALFIKQQPKAGNLDVAMFNLALAYQKLNRAPEAIKTLSQLLALQKKRSTKPGAKPANGLAEGGLKNNAYADFCKLIYQHERIAARKKEFLTQAATANIPEAHYYLGWLALTQGKSDEAIAAFGKLYQRHAKHPLAFDAGLQRAILQIRQDKFGEAHKTLSYLARSNGKHPKISEAIFYRGLCMARREKYKEAVKDFAVVMDKYPKSPVMGQAVYWRGWAEKQQGNAAEAGKYFALVRAKFPDAGMQKDVVLEAAELAFGQKQYAEVIKQVEPMVTDRNATKGKPLLRERCLYLLGWSRYHGGDMGKSALSFEAMLREFPKSRRAASAAFQAGEARLNKREYAPAAKHFALAEARSQGTPAHAPALLRLTQSLALCNNFKQSGLHAGAFIEKYPKHEYFRQAQFSLGWALENQKKYPEAIEQYKKLLAGGPRDETAAKAQFQYAECLFVQNKFEPAMTQFTLVETRYRLPKYTSKAIIEVGRILEKQDQPEAARARYSEVLKRFPDSTAAGVAQQLLNAVNLKIKNRR